MTELKKQIIDIFQFTDNEFQEIQGFFQPKKLKKGDYFIEEGQYVKQMGFVEQGVLREFLFVNDKEVTKWFSTGGYFAVDLAAFLNNKKSRVSYQALGEVELLVISKANYDKIGAVVERWNNLEKMFLTKCFAVLENRVIAHLSLNAEERYQQFFESNPRLFNQVPLHQIASMLGMTPETLSRIRSKQSH